MTDVDIDTIRWRARMRGTPGVALKAKKPRAKKAPAT
jgi:hypothetical protein